MDRSMIDAANGGALVDLMPAATKNLISNLIANSQQFWTRVDQTPKRVNEISTPSLKNSVEELTSLMHQFIIRIQQVKSYGICSNIGHVTNMCPTLHEGPIQQVSTTSVFLGPVQHKYDPHANSYNLSWRDHPNFSYGNNQN